MSDNIRFERLAPSMAPALAAFIREEIDPYLPIHLDQKLTVGSVEEYAEKITRLADGCVALMGDEIVGLVAGYIRHRYDGNTVFLTIYGVAKLLRRRGVGSMLMQKLLDDVPPSCTVRTTVDERNHIACKAYASAGFLTKGIRNGRIFLERPAEAREG